MLVLIAVLVFLTVVLAVIAMALVPEESPRLIHERLDRYLGGQPAASTPTKLVSTFRASLRRAGRIFEASDYVTRLGEQLERAGLPFGGPEFLVFSLILTAGLASVSFILSRNLLCALAMGTLGILGPIMAIRIHLRKRISVFNTQLADALTTISNSLRAGYSFMQAMDVVSREMLPPLSEEFLRTLKDIRLGASTEDSLMSLAERVPSDDLKLAVTAILIQRQVGGNLAEVLDNIAATIRERIKIKAEIKTLTTQGKLSGVIIGLLPVAVGGIMFAISPGYIAPLFSHPLGRFMLAYAIISELVGAFLVWRIVSIEV